MKKLFIITLFISGVMQTNALVISEIMYDPAGANTSHRWIEVYNDEESNINITDSWKFFENGVNHKISPYSNVTSIPPKGYAIIAEDANQFSADYSFTGILFDSAFTHSNKNGGDHLAIKESSTGDEISPVDYNPEIGGDDDGTTLSKIDNMWVRGEATPGAENKNATTENKIVKNTTPSNTVDIKEAIAQKSPPAPDIVFYMPFEKMVIAGAESSFSTYGLTRSGKAIDNLVCIWAFGDGGQAVGTSTKYTYAYPGRYIAQVEGNNGYVTGVGRMNVRVVPPDISIIKIDKGKYGLYVDISNPNSYELDLSQWKLSINGVIFPFPKNTLIASNSVTHFSGTSMGFANMNLAGETVVKILFPNQEEVTKLVINTLFNNNFSATSTTNTSSSTQSVTIKSEIKPLIKVVTKQSSSIKKQQLSQQVSTSSPKINKTRDRRIINFFKSLFGA